MIEVGYQQHAPRAEALGQNKYVEVWLGQQDSLYRDHPYSRLQECCMNRVVRRYDAATGKRCVGHDEFMEHGNCFFPVTKCRDHSPALLNRVHTLAMG